MHSPDGLRLPDSYRRVIELTELEGMTQAAAAERLGLSIPGAKSRVQRGRARLRAMLLRCCEIETDRHGRVIAFETRDGEGCAPCAEDRRSPIKVASGPRTAVDTSSGCVPQQRSMTRRASMP